MAKTKEFEEKAAGAGESGKSGKPASESSADKASGPETEALKREVVDDLSRLRPLVREVADKYVARLEAELFQVAEAVKARDVSEASGKVRRGLAKLKEEADALGLRPEKARRKDLKRIENFLDDAMEIVEGW